MIRRPVSRLRARSGVVPVSEHAEVAPAWIMAMEASVTVLVLLRRQPRMQ